MKDLILVIAVVVFMAVGWALMGGVDAFLARARRDFERENTEEALPPVAVAERKAG